MSDDVQEIVLVDEDGVEHHFNLVDVILVDDQRYALLEPQQGDEEGAFVFRVESGDDGDDQLVEVEDDAEFERVVAALEALDDMDHEHDHVHGPDCNHGPEED